MKIFSMEQNNKIPARNASPGDAGGEHKIVQTYAEDMANAIKDSKGGIIKKMIHGEGEHEIERRNLSPESKKNKFFMFTSLFLIFLALGTLSFFFFSKKDIPIVLVEKQFTPIIFNDQSVLIEVRDFKKDEITKAVWDEVNLTKVKSGGIEGIYLTEDKKIIGLRKFVALIKGNFAPANFSFVNDSFLLGVVNAETKDFFILLKVRTLPDIFDSLRSWEGKMFFDLYGFFGINLESKTNYLLTKDFEDGIVENKNARILYDKENKIVMMYVFADDNSIIITNTESATQEIMLRLAGSQVKK